jgi:hypothetical protein
VVSCGFHEDSFIGKGTGFRSGNHKKQTGCIKTGFLEGGRALPSSSKKGKMTLVSGTMTGKKRRLCVMETVRCGDTGWDKNSFLPFYSNSFNVVYDIKKKKENK